MCSWEPGAGARGSVVWAGYKELHVIELVLVNMVVEGPDQTSHGAEQTDKV